MMDGLVAQYSAEHQKWAAKRICTVYADFGAKTEAAQRAVSMYAVESADDDLSGLERLCADLNEWSATRAAFKAEIASLTKSIADVKSSTAPAPVAPVVVAPVAPVVVAPAPVAPVAVAPVAVAPVAPVAPVVDANAEIIQLLIRAKAYLETLAQSAQ